MIDADGCVVRITDSEIACNWPTKEDGVWCDEWPVVTLYHEDVEGTDNYENPLYLNYCERHASDIMDKYRTYGIELIEPDEQIAELKAQLEVAEAKSALMTHVHLNELRKRRESVRHLGDWWWDFWHSEDGKHMIAGIEVEHPPRHKHFLCWFDLEHHEQPEFIDDFIPVMDYIAQMPQDTDKLLAHIDSLEQQLKEKKE